MLRIWYSQRGQLRIGKYFPPSKLDEATEAAHELATENKGKNIYLEDSNTGAWRRFVWFWDSSECKSGLVDIMQIEVARESPPPG
jgi:hypothetical protein